MHEPAPTTAEPVVDPDDGSLAPGPEPVEQAVLGSHQLTATIAPSTASAPAPAVAAPALTTIEKLRDGQIGGRLAGWIMTLVITAAAFALRLIGIGYPSHIVFDETYYAKDGWSLLKHGYEVSWTDKANDLLLTGDFSGMKTDPAFIVHPQVGKWLIGAGEHFFGMNSFGWRISACVFGTLLVFVTIRLARRLGRSNLVGAIAGILLTVDGLAFTMSRIALLDGFQAFFVVAGVACVVADRDYYRSRLASYLDKRGLTDLGGRFGPMIWLRPWLLLGGIMFGLALGTKWSSIYPLALMGVLSVVWTVSARRLAGASWRSAWSLLVDGGPAFVRLVVLSGAVYVATWASWLATQGGWDRQWGAEHPDSRLVRWLGKPLGSLAYYHKEIYEFHTGQYIKDATHPYEAHPAGWLFMVRPIGIDAVNDIPTGTDGCTADKCLRVISGAGTPFLWWCAALALGFGLVWWLARRDWRFGVPVLAALVSWLPWFQYSDRALFFFYAITIVPFTVIGLAVTLGLPVGPPVPRGLPISPAVAARRRMGTMIAGVIVALVVLNFAFMYPIYTDKLLTYPQWQMRMWFRTWI